MDYQKDNKRTEISSSHKGNFEDSKSLIHKPFFEYLNKKTQKIVTALYMVTDCMESDDALKSRIRSIGVALLSDMFRTPELSPVERSGHISRLSLMIEEVLTLLEISSTMGFVSEMNATILKRELSHLISELGSNFAKNDQFNFALDRSMFDTPIPEEKKYESPLSDIKDKRTPHIPMSFRNTPSTQLSSFHRVTSNNVLNNGISKEERATKIVSLIKDKKDPLSGEKGMSIKDISIAFTDCSEKTIQRELNSLVAKGTIKKIGAKRWSRYTIV